MRIDVYKKIINEVVVGASEGKNGCYVDVSDMYVDNNEADDICKFITSGLGLICNIIKKDNKINSFFVNWGIILCLYRNK